MDMKVVVDWDLIFHYLLKYVTKAEDCSKHMTEVNLQATTIPDMTSLKYVKKLCSKVLGSRDMSQQEVSICIARRELFWSDFNFVSLSLGDQAMIYKKDLTINPARTYWKKYIDRNEAIFAPSVTEDQ